MGPSRAWQPRLALESDGPAIEALIPLSVHELQAPFYSRAQRDAALGLVFALDLQLIRDRTYFVVESDGVLVGCGGWSRRRAGYGGNAKRSPVEPTLDPATDAARIRAFFVHPSWARRGVGRSLMQASEGGLRAAGFRRAEIVATLVGEVLYAAFGYATVERWGIPLPDGLELPVVRMTKSFDQSSTVSSSCVGPA